MSYQNYIIPSTISENGYLNLINKTKKIILVVESKHVKIIM